jgi:hypothetical protein
MIFFEVKGFELRVLKKSRSLVNGLGRGCVIWRDAPRLHKHSIRVLAPGLLNWDQRRL